MTVEADLFTRCQALLGGRFYPDAAPEGTATPYAVYQQVGGEALTFVEATVPDKANGRFQFAVWAKTRVQAADLARQLEALLITATAFQATPLGAMVADFDQETGLRGARQDFSIWYAR